MRGDALALGAAAALALAGLTARRGSRTAERSAAFRRWFGASKVVDRSGRPLVVYHGTPSEEPFEVFDQGRWGETGGKLPGYYFSGMARTADAYRPTDEVLKPRYRAEVEALERRKVEVEARLLAQINAAHGTSHAEYDIFLKDREGRFIDDYGLPSHGEHRAVRRALSTVYDDTLRLRPKLHDRVLRGRRIAAFLSLQDPYEVDASGAAWSADFEKRLRAVLRERGVDLLGDHDGLILRNLYDGEVGLRDDIYVAFRPEQIKSVDNRGTWSSSDPRMSFNRRRGAR